MARTSKNVSQRQLYGLLTGFGLVLTVLIVLATIGAWAGYTFATNQVGSQLSQEKISFPAAGSTGFDASEYPSLQQYAGQPVDNGVKAKAYADDYIWHHMMKASGGKTYAEVSAAAKADPSNTALAGLKATLFQGDMLRSSLLTAYAFSVFGIIAGYAVVVSLLASGVVLFLTFISFIKAKRA